MQKDKNRNSKNRFIRHVLIVLLCGISPVVSFVTAAQMSPNYASWGYQSIQSVQPAGTRTATTYGSSAYSKTTYGYGTMTGTTYTPFTGSTQDLNYQFGTTSAYIHPAKSNPKRSNWSENTMYGSGWDEDPEDYDPLGIVPDPPVPVGDTPWLFILLVAGYFLLRRGRTKKKAHENALFSFPSTHLKQLQTTSNKGRSPRLRD